MTDPVLIERLAREADLVTEPGADGFMRASIPETDWPHEGNVLSEFPASLCAFAALIAEECAKVCDAATDTADDAMDTGACGSFIASAAASIREKFKP